MGIFNSHIWRRITFSMCVFLHVSKKFANNKCKLLDGWGSCIGSIVVTSTKSTKHRIHLINLTKRRQILAQTYETSHKLKHTQKTHIYQPNYPQESELATVHLHQSLIPTCPRAMICTQTRRSTGVGFQTLSTMWRALDKKEIYGGCTTATFQLFFLIVFTVPVEIVSCPVPLQTAIFQSCVCLPEGTSFLSSVPDGSGLWCPALALHRWHTQEPCAKLREDLLTISQLRLSFKSSLLGSWNTCCIYL